MSPWLTTVLTSAALPIVTSAITTLTIGPRLQTRSIRIQALHADRDEFRKQLLTILTICGVLQDWKLPADASETARARLNSESDRLLTRLDEATQWLADNLPRYGLAYLNALGIPHLAGRYVGAARSLMLSDRPVAVKARMLGELAEPVQAIFMRRRQAVRSIRAEIIRLNKILDMLDADDSHHA